MVERRLRREVPERLLHDGRFETALDEAAVRDAVRVLREARVEAVAICFLYSFLDPAHEEAARHIVSEEFPEAFVCASHEVAPEFREYERLSTTVVNAYLGPVMAFYTRGVADRLNALGVAVTPYLTQSNGGVIGFDAAARLPVRTVLSGPSTGVVGAQVSARLAGAQDIITFDMGGTSTDVALMQGGEARLARGGGARLSDQGPDARHPYGRRRRRLDRVHRQRRIAQGRAAQRRCRSGPPAMTGGMLSRRSLTPISFCRL